MDRIHTGSDVSRGIRSSDFPTHHGDYFSRSGYHSSLSLPKAASRDGHVLAGGFLDPLIRDGLGVKEGRPEPLSSDGYGGYSYSSSYDDMRQNALEGRYSYSRQSEDSKSFEGSPYAKYDYGPDKASSFHESYRGSSLAPYIMSVSDFDGSLASSGPLTSCLYGDDGPKPGISHQDLCHQRATDDSYQSQYDYLSFNKTSIASMNMPSVFAFEQSASVREDNANLQAYDFSYPPRDSGGLSGGAPDYEQASGLSRNYGSNFSGMLPTFGAWGDSRNAGGSSLSNVQEPYALARTGNVSRFMDDSVYTDLKDLSKFGSWNIGAVKQAQPEIDQKGRIGSFASVSGNKVVEGSMQMLGVDSGREATEKKKRPSRWEPVEENEKNGQNESEKKKKKSRWSEEIPASKELNLPNILKGGDSDEIALRAQLIIINKKLQSGHVVDDRPEAERSPSPEPVYDNVGYQVNTREYRARERLTKERQQIIAKLSEKTTTFKLPPDFKQAKFSKRLYVPVDKHPDYNFVGLIIGPRGHTQKKMEKESGAKIFIRGKGSLREGASTHIVSDETEKLHVLIEADIEESVNKAVGMVEKLLVPVRDEQNEHKKAQLRELASLNGTLRSNESCHVCRETGHVAKDCPMTGLMAGSSAVSGHKGETSQDNVHCDVCKGPGHLSKECPLIQPTSGSLSKGGYAGSGGLQVMDSWVNNDNDNTVLYITFLPLSVNDAHLRSLFAPFGQVVHAKIMRHLTTGISKSYGFVKFLDATDAAQAVALMNGYQLEEKVLSVKLKMNAGAVS